MLNSFKRWISKFQFIFYISIIIFFFKLEYLAPILLRFPFKFIEFIQKGFEIWIILDFLKDGEWFLLENHLTLKVIFISNIISVEHSIFNLLIFKFLTSQGSLLAFLAPLPPFRLLCFLLVQIVSLKFLNFLLRSIIHHY